MQSIYRLYLKRNVAKVIWHRKRAMSDNLRAYRAKYSNKSGKYLT
jgi:hypothetical protein